MLFTDNVLTTILYSTVHHIIQFTKQSQLNCEAQMMLVPTFHSLNPLFSHTLFSTWPCTTFTLLASSSIADTVFCLLSLPTVFTNRSRQQLSIFSWTAYLWAMCKFAISYSHTVMQWRALLLLPLTLPLSHSAFFLRRALSVWICLSVRYSWCLLFSSRQASQMASLKVLIDARCLLIKKLLSLTTAAVHRDRHTHSTAWTQPQGRGLKKQKMTTTSTQGEAASQRRTK